MVLLRLENEEPNILSKVKDETQKKKLEELNQRIRDSPADADKYYERGQYLRN